ncbi:hypothetical protein GCM10023321_00770 [Pseudonocardia eucalypti]|uniref:Uncharacterized protein n=1 Tax=Pseudonocardia eucalypti TaxID=648755 RepID=A0ABP9PEI8_9PSEU|nr:hypothetical protein [Pseudonocardia eucalypti]
MARHRSPRGRQDESTSVFDDEPAVPEPRAQSSSAPSDEDWMPAPRRPTHSGGFDAEPVDRPGTDLAELETRSLFEPAEPEPAEPEPAEPEEARTEAIRPPARRSRGAARRRMRASGARRRADRAGRPSTRTLFLVAGAVVALVAGGTVLVGLRSNSGSGESTNANIPLAQPAVPPAADAPAGPAPDVPAPDVPAAPPKVKPSPATKPGTAAKSTTKNAAKKPAATGNKASGGTGSDGGPAYAGTSKQLKIELTGYSYQDNTPPGSAEVSNPVLHKKAGGTGTYADPITVAVPGKGTGIFKAGSRFYLPTVKRYVIAEDTGASAAGSGDGHLDMWIGGEGGTKSATDACMNKITGDVPAEYNPPPGRPVLSGPIYAGGKCNIPGGGGSSSKSSSSEDN